MDKNSIYFMGLQQVFPIGSHKIKEALSYFDCAEHIIKASKEELCNSGIFQPLDIAKLKRIDLNKATDLYHRTVKIGVKIIPMDAESYPQRLYEIYSPPLVLYVLGDISEIDEILTISVVGTRKMTEYGKKITENIAYHLAKAGVTVVSGLAVGIDSAAHHGAVLAKGRTIGVMGCGLDVDYPAINRALKKHMLNNGSALLSEFPLGTPPFGRNFPVRNRIIAGLSVGVLVVEGDINSGALITAKQALDQNKDIFAVPGDVFQITSQAPNSLIKQGAIPVTSAKDILEEYHILYEEQPMIIEENIQDEKPKQKPPAPDYLTKEQFLVYNLIDEHPVSIEEIFEKCDIPTGQILSCLTELEMEGLIRSYPGRKFSI